MWRGVCFGAGSSRRSRKAYTWRWICARCVRYACCDRSNLSPAYRVSSASVIDTDRRKRKARSEATSRLELGENTYSWLSRETEREREKVRRSVKLPLTTPVNDAQRRSSSRELSRDFRSHSYLRTHLQKAESAFIQCRSPQRCVVVVLAVCILRASREAFSRAEQAASLFRGLDDALAKCGGVWARV